jgi:fumarylacetoacetase
VNDQLNATHDPNLQSWIESANDPQTDFPPQNLPYCVFLRDGVRRIGAGIGDRILDLFELSAAGLLPSVLTEPLQSTCLNALMGADLDQRQALRAALCGLVTDRKSALAESESLQRRILVPQNSVNLELPATIGDYTDFYASLFHATNVGSMFRPDNPLLPNYKHIPIGYHGRASSIVPSGMAVRRPSGQLPPAVEGAAPTFGACQNLDYELELGFWVGKGNRLGESIPLSSAEAHLFGVCLLNDWSARDMQRWEYQPLGPFLAKNFASSISPWVVTMEALQPFRCEAFARPEGDPQPLPYLTDSRNERSGGIEIQLEVWLSSRKMRDQQLPPTRLSHGTFAQMYWTAAQILTHHASNGCNLRSGDLLGSGTVSGPLRESRGCLLELTWNGEFGRPVPGNQRTPLALPSGEQRTFLADGDEVIFRGWCERSGMRRIGLGECRGMIEGAI